MELDYLEENISVRTLEEEIRALPEPLLIYGAGAFGREVYQILRQQACKVHGFLDGYAADGDRLFDLPVWNLTNVPQAVKEMQPLVLFSIVMDGTERAAVMDTIRKAGFSQIRPSQSLRCWMVQPDDQTPEETLKTYYQTRRSRLEAAAALFTDPRSQMVYQGNLRAHMTRNYADCTWEEPMAEQYFPPDIPWKRHTRVVDCGAYIGDTASQWLQQEGTLEQYIGLEPNPANFARLRTFCSTHSQQLGAITLFPCGVDHVTGLSGFQTGTGSGRVDATGDQIVPCVALDDVLQNQPVDLIKMDIEGAEYRALKASRQLITTARPDLAICVYHHTNHLWDIPLLLHEWDLGYTFWLRTYNDCTMETVLYATCTKPKGVEP